MNNYYKTTYFISLPNVNLHPPALATAGYQSTLEETHRTGLLHPHKNIRYKTPDQRNKLRAYSNPDRNSPRRIPWLIPLSCLTDDVKTRFVERRQKVFNAIESVREI